MMATEGGFSGLFQKAKEKDAFWVGKAIREFTEDLYELMEQRGLNKTQLAEKINTSPAYITKVLRGNTNFTIETMVKLVRALDGQLVVKAAKKEDELCWVNFKGGNRNRREIMLQGFEAKASVDVTPSHAQLEAEDNDEYPTAA